MPGLAWRLALAVCLVLLFARAINFHRQLIEFPYPLDMAEPAEGILAQGVAAGLDPGDPQNLPLMANQYGPLYELLTGNLCRLGLACGLQSQRLLTALFLASILALLAVLCRRVGADRLETAATVAWAYALLLIHFTPLARPDGLGLLLWFAGLSVPFLFGVGLIPLAGAAVLFSLSVLSKYYFLVGPFYLGCHLFLRQRRAFLRFALIQALALGVALLWMMRAFPYGLYTSVLFQANYNSVYELHHMLLQLWVILVLASPALLPLGFVSAWMGRQSRIAPVEAATGILSAAPWGLYFALGLLIFVTILGGTNGALFTYLIQLAVLPGLVWMAACCPRLPRWRWVLNGFLVLNAFCAFRVALHKGFEPGGPLSGAWEHANAVVQAARQPVVSSDLDLSVEARGLPIFDTGLSDLRPLRAPVPKGWKSLLFPDLEAVLSRDTEWTLRARQAMLDPRTDLVAVTNFSPLYMPDVLASRFKPLERIQIVYPQCGWAAYWLEFYVPKKKATKNL
jgi:hypothetical protein